MFEFIKIFYAILGFMISSTTLASGRRTPLSVAVNQCQPCPHQPSPGTTCQDHRQNMVDAIDGILQDVSVVYNGMVINLREEEHYHSTDFDPPSTPCDAYQQLTEASMRLRIAETLLPRSANTAVRVRDPLCSLNHMMRMLGTPPQDCECEQTETVRHVRGRTYRFLRGIDEVRQAIGMLRVVRDHANDHMTSWEYCP